MAKQSKIAKFKKQEALVARYAERRQALKAAGDLEGLRQLPTDSLSPQRPTNSPPG